MNHSAPVALVGAGPGNPGLLTLRAVECLAQADLVLYDRLVPGCLLEFAPDEAELLCVDQLPGCHPERVPGVHLKMIEAARAGRRVVRLKGGDPFVFGRGGEEAEALAEAGVECEIVPGVTAALGAAAYAGLPLTDRRWASAVAFITGHEKEKGGGTPPLLDWAALAHFPGTLVVYMGMARLPQVVGHLVDNGMSADTPAAAVQWAATGRQRTVEAPLGGLVAAVETAGLKAPAVVVVGVAAKRRLPWFEKRPLFGKRVLVTRPRHQAGDMVRRLEQLGAVVAVMPTVEVKPPADWGPVDRAVADLPHYQWLVFTSANGVHFFLRRLRQIGRDVRALGSVKLAVIGPATADALREYHLEPDLIPPQFRSESLATALKERAAGQRILLARADRGRDLLRQELSTVAEVEQVAVYSQVDAVEIDLELLEEINQGRIDCITLTSSKIAEALIRLLSPAGRQLIRSGDVQLVSISPVTSAAIRKLDLPVAAEAAEYTAAKVVEALVSTQRQQVR
ncbi:MAG TPA: uroporphyrinogen-III C-methyltransferase [Gemmataceae bacterium]|nr:uroporphyrinogen-III C-methyltransferase [Gemmataceae bacterium]